MLTYSVQYLVAQTATLMYQGNVAYISLCRENVVLKAEMKYFILTLLYFINVQTN